MNTTNAVEINQVNSLLYTGLFVSITGSESHTYLAAWEYSDIVLDSFTLIYP